MTEDADGPDGNTDAADGDPGEPVVLVVATDHRQGSVDARRLDEGRTVWLAFGADEATGALTDAVDVVAVDADLDDAGVDDVVSAAADHDCPVLAITRGGEPAWADAVLVRPLAAEEAVADVLGSLGA